jgi:hypothetical protein
MVDVRDVTALMKTRSGVLIDFRYRARPSAASDAPQRIPDAAHPVGLRLVTPKVNTIGMFFLTLNSRIRKPTFRN